MQCTGVCRVTIYSCWIFFGSNLSRVLHSFLLFSFVFVRFLTMTFLSRLMFKGWVSWAEEELRPALDWFRTSKKFLSCRLKSYSTLDGQTYRQIIKHVKNVNIAQQQQQQKIQIFIKKNLKYLFWLFFLTMFIKHRHTTNHNATMYCTLCATPHKGSFEPFLEQHLYFFFSKQSH